MAGINYSNLSNIIDDYLNKIGKAPRGYWRKVGWLYFIFSALYDIFGIIKNCIHKHTNILGKVTLLKINERLGNKT